MFVVEITPQLFFHYFLQGNIVIGHRKNATVLSISDIRKLKLERYKLIEIQS